MKLSGPGTLDLDEVPSNFWEFAKFAWPRLKADADALKFFNSSEPLSVLLGLVPKSMGLPMEETLRRAAEAARAAE